jgi:hypothetical protein
VYKHTRSWRQYPWNIGYLNTMAALTAGARVPFSVSRFSNSLCSSSLCISLARYHSVLARYPSGFLPVLSSHGVGVTGPRYLYHSR